MIYIFDLDLTIWETNDKNGNQIWAKQLVPPFDLSGDKIVDDVFSECILKKGIVDYLNYLRRKGHELGFITSAKYTGLPFDLQPSLLVLKRFNLLDIFDFCQVIEYKDFDKSNFLKKIKKEIVFYDDSDEHLNSVAHLENIRAVDSKRISDWTKLINKS